MPEHSNSEEAPQLTQTVEEQLEIVTFDSDLAVVSEGLPFETNIPLMPSEQHTDAQQHSIVSYLKRPQLLSTFRWTTAADRSTNLFRPAGRTDGLLVPTGLFSNRAMIREKLSGFTSFKATAVLKLQINSQPFQCGRLVMAAAPVPNLLGYRRQFIFSHVAQTQNVNHVQMDINKDTEVELRIPFISPYNSFDLIEGKFDWAEVRILVYSKLQSQGEAPNCLQCLVWGHFEDIELGAPTSGRIVQQSRMPSRGAIDNTKKKESTGSFTGALAQLGTSLVNKGASSLIAALGWSKPILAKPSRVFLNRPTEGFGYMDGVDHSIVLGMTASNQVEPIPGLVGTNIDETSFNTLKRIPQMIGAFTYDNSILTCDSDNRNPVKLWECAVAPTTYVPACYYVQPSATGENVRNPYSFRWKQPTTLNYISSPFLYWTGSLVYTFKFVKTGFHSGRVEISFHPFVNTLPTTGAPPNVQLDNERFDFVYKTVVDLRENSEVSVTIPYIAAQPWKRISTYLDPVNPNPPKPGRLKDVITGILCVRALTPLIVSNAVAPNRIECLVEMRAGDDYEVSCPVTSKFMPFSFQNETNPVQQSGVSALRTGAITRQMNFLWNTTNASDKIRTVTGLGKVKYVGIDIWGTVFQWNDANSSWRWRLRFSWDENRPVEFGRNDRNMDIHYYVTMENPGNVEDLTVSFEGVQISPAANSNNCRCLFDINFYPITSTTTGTIVSIDPAQLPLPVANEGSGGTVKIDETQLPLHVKVEQPDGPVAVVIEEQPVDVNLVSESEGVNGNVRITNWPAKQLVELDEKPVEVIISEDQLPLPTSSSGGEGGNTVTINPDQLPLWINEYNVAPFDPRNPPPSAKRPRQQSGEVSSAGITETRTRAMEGWMPPSITGSANDAHRPSTASLCIGEKFTTFRQYAKRFAFCMVNSLDSSKMFPIQPVEFIRPGALYLRPTAESTGNNERTQLTLYAPNSKSELSGSPLAFVAGMYAFYRGSTRFKVWMDPRENPPNMLSGHLEYTRQIVDTNIISDNIENFMTPIAYETPTTKQIPEYQVPYYSPTIVSSTWSHGVDNQFDTPLVNLVLSIPDFRQNTGNFPIKIAAAAGDDMDFHQFIGPPPVINVGDVLIEDRFLHYPPTGFTPTQKIALNPNEANRRTELPASSFIPVPYSALRVQNNVAGGSCPEAPGAAKVTFINDVPTLEGKSLEPEVMMSTQGIPILNEKKKRRPKKEIIVFESDSEGHDTVDTKDAVSRSRRSIPSYQADSGPTLSDYYYE